MNDLVPILSDVEFCSYAEVITLFACDTNIKTLLRKLVSDRKIAISWFECNYMKINIDKCHILISGNKHEKNWIKIGWKTI